MLRMQKRPKYIRFLTKHNRKSAPQKLNNELLRWFLWLQEHVPNPQCYQLKYWRTQINIPSRISLHRHNSTYEGHENTLLPQTKNCVARRKEREYVTRRIHYRDMEFRRLYDDWSVCRKRASTGVSERTWCSGVAARGRGWAGEREEDRGKGGGRKRKRKERRLTEG